MSLLKRSSLMGLVTTVIILIALAAGVWVASQQTSFAKKPKCGDKKCQKGETFESCPDDCPNPCGNGKCEKKLGETYLTCLKDCPNPCRKDGQSIKVNKGQFCCEGLRMNHFYQWTCHDNGATMECKDQGRPMCLPDITVTPPPCVGDGGGGGYLTSCP